MKRQHTSERRYEKVKRCLAEADRAWTAAGAADDPEERIRLIDEAEAWLLRAERDLTRLADRPAAVAHPERLQGEARSFEAPRPAARSLVWRRTAKP